MTLWGGRFFEQPNPLAWAFNTSLPVDRRLAPQDMQASLAWAQALHTAGILSDEEHAAIEGGLAAIQQEFSGERFIFAPSDEDIHTAVERRLTELVGQVAGKLHTGRSRNDQVTTDFRLWMLQTIPLVDGALAGVQEALVLQAEAAGGTLMPGYTHLQRAQPLLLAHWWLCHYWPLQRDRSRIADLSRRVSILPLGSGALAGTSVEVDRLALAQALGFAEASPNSLDAVSDRDFAAEYLFCAALTGIHLSRLAEQVVIFSSAEFGFFELSEAFATGSSLMPQKKNPDAFELTRGKAGTLLGMLTGWLTTLKGLPSAYDKDLQEDKAPVFAATDTLLTVLPVVAGAVRSIIPHPERMRQAIDSTLMATDLADYLVAKGIPFRESHNIVGQAIRAAEERHLPLEEMPLEVYQALCPAFEADLYQALDPLRSVEKRNSMGGTSPRAVKEQITRIKKGK